MDLDATLAAIDAVTGCQQCEGSLDDSPSDDFCSQDCQELWHSDRAILLDHYREPYDVPGHVYNLVEHESAETTPGSWESFARRWFLGFNPVGFYTDRPLANLEVTADGTLFMHVTPDTSASSEAFAHMRRSAEQAARRMRANARAFADAWTQTFHWIDEIQSWPVERLDVAALQPGQAVIRNRFGEATFDLATVDVPAVSTSPVVTADMISQVRAATEPPQVELPVNVQARALEQRRNRNTGPQQQNHTPRAINPRRAR